MKKKGFFGVLTLIVGVVLVFALAGCGDNGDPSSPPGGNGGNGGNGGGNPGTNVATKYRFTSNSTHSSEWTGPGNNDETGITVTVGENTITWVGGTGGSFTNVSTDSDKNLNGGSMVGTWAYLYSGSNKIGFVIAFSNLAGGIKQVFTGKRHVQAFMLTTGATLLGVSDFSSEIAESVKNISGEYDPNP